MPYPYSDEELDKQRDEMMKRYGVKPGDGRKHLEEKAKNHPDPNVRAAYKHLLNQHQQMGSYGSQYTIFNRLIYPAIWFLAIIAAIYYVFW